MKKVKLLAIVLAAVMMALPMSGCLNGKTSEDISYFSLALSSTATSSKPKAETFTVSADYEGFGWYNQKNVDMLLNVFSDYDTTHQVYMKVVSNTGTPLDAANAEIDKIANFGEIARDIQWIVSEPQQTTVGSGKYDALYLEVIYTQYAAYHYHMYFLVHDGVVMEIVEQYQQTIAERDRSESTAIIDSITITDIAQ